MVKHQYYTTSSSSLTVNNRNSIPLGDFSKSIKMIEIWKCSPVRKQYLVQSGVALTDEEGEFKQCIGPREDVVPDEH
jgi:hypothetical protein